MFSFPLFVVLGATLASAQTFSAPVPSYSATYLPYNTPQKSEQGQTGTNQCGTESSQDSECQNSYLSALDDFCLWAPPQPDSLIGDTESFEVAWCLRSGYGTRVIPPGAITGAHFIQTPNYLQITGTGDLTKINVSPKDSGGELDPHGADGNGNPVGGLVFGYGNGGILRQYHEWTNFIDGPHFFCFRVCISQPGSTQYCEHIYDVMGCGWNMPGNYSEGFSTCIGNSTLPMGIYIDNGVTSTFREGDPSTPPPHPAARSSECTYYATLSNYGSPAPTPSGSLIKSKTVVLTSATTTNATVTSTTGSSTSTITGKPSSIPSTTGISTSTTSHTSKSGGAATAVVPSLVFAKANFGSFVGASMLLGTTFLLVL